MKKIKAHRVSRSVGGNLVLLVFLGILGAFMLLPMIYVVGNAFKPVSELYLFPPRILPQNWTVNNFLDLYNLVSELSMPLSRYMFNTILLTVVGTICQVVLSSLCAYSLAKVPFPGANGAFQMIVLSLMFSASVTSVPQYIMLSKMNLYDTYWAMMLPALTTTLGLYLMKQFLESSVPDALMEAGRIDGASELRIFFDIVMPLLKPAWLTLIILSIQQLWNAQSSFTYSEIYKTLPQALHQIVAGGISRIGVGGAVSLIMMAIPILTFVISQSNIIETMGSSGMKD